MPEDEDAKRVADQVFFRGVEAGLPESELFRRLGFSEAIFYP